MSQGFIHSGFNAKVAGDVVQVQRYETGTGASGTTVMPVYNDNTIPQNTEGDQYMTVSITPTNVNSTLKIDVVAYCDGSSATQGGVALFQDSTADALAAGVFTARTSMSTPVVVSHTMAAGTVSSTTFKVRCGLRAAGTFYLNGTSDNSGQILGGVLKSSITVTEIASGTLIREVGTNINGNAGVAKAWANFNGSGTPAMNAAHNFSNTITDNGVGDYTLTFTTPFSSANYCVQITANGGGYGVGIGYVSATAKTASTLRISCADHNGAGCDPTDISVVCFGTQ